MAYYNGNKSKYLRDPNEKKQSKYLRDKDDKKSKYERDRNETREHHYNLARNYREEEEITEELPEEEEEFTEIEETPEVKETELETTSSFEAEPETISSFEAEPETEQPVELYEADELDFENETFESDSSLEESWEESSKGDQSSLFVHSKLSRDTTVAHVEDNDEKRRKLIIMTVIVMVVLGVAAYGLFFAKIKLPHTPDMLNFELSIIPELIASLAYGPIFGIIIIIVKTLVLLFTSDTAYATLLSGFVLDSLFVFVVGLFYSKRMFAINPKQSLKPTEKDKRRGRILLGGVIATALTTTVSFFLTKFVSYPMLISQYGERFGINEYYILNDYQEALNSLNTALPETVSSTVNEFANITQGILFYNIPLTIVKLLIITLAVVVFYPIFSPYIHFRKKTK